MEKSKKIAVIGAGFMGAVIASIYARYGYNVALHDQIPSVLGSFHDRALPNVQNLSNAEHSVEDIFGNITVESELDGAIDGAFLVHEIVQEDLRAKQELFALLDRRCESHVVLATNTS
jgi:3-hydroxybutyryl-CoA dehydrogenase